MNVRRFTAAAGVMGLALGCGGGNPFPMAHVSGTLTYADGGPVEAAAVEVFFIPQTADPIDGKHPRPSTAAVQPDGSFAGMSTITKGDGVMVGRHKVVVEAMRGDFTPDVRAIAARYRDADQTPLEVEVAREGPNVFHLKVERGP